MTTRYLYEYDKVILELNGDGSEKARNVQGTNLISRATEGQNAYYFYNGHADVTLLQDENGQQLASYYYDAFGNPVSVQESVYNPYRYAGYQWDDETGLYYLNARMYDPVTARFMQEDTYSGDPNDPLSLNLYTYCHNEPIMYNDPSGHVAKKVVTTTTKKAATATKTPTKATNSKTPVAVKASNVAKGSKVTYTPGKTQGTSKITITDSKGKKTTLSQGKDYYVTKEGKAYYWNKSSSSSSSSKSSSSISPKPSNTLSSVAGNFVAGVGQGVKSTANGTVQLVTHPVKTTKAVGTVVSNVAQHPIKTVKAIGNVTTKTYNQFMAGDANTKANMLGRGAFETAMFALPATKIAKAGEAGELANAAGKAGEIAETTSNVGKGFSIDLQLFAEEAGKSSSKIILKDGMTLESNQALDAAEEFLGKGYKDMGNGRYVSANGTKQVRMTDSDLSTINNHAGSPHMNFETGKTVTKPNGKESFIPNKNGNMHIKIK